MFEVERLGEGVLMPHAHAAGRMSLQFLYRLTKQRREGEGEF